MTSVASKISKRLTRRKREKDDNKRLRSSSFASASAEEASSSLSGGSRSISFPRPRCVTLDVSDHQRDSLVVQPDPHFDEIARKLDKLDDKFRSESRQIRKQKRRASIDKARADYLECLEALNQMSTSLSSNESSTTTPPEKAACDFFTENGLLDWKEYEL